MSISVEMLREDIKDYYTDLSIIQKDVKVPTKVIDGSTIFVIPLFVACKLWLSTENIVTEDISKIKTCVPEEVGVGGCVKSQYS